MSIPFAVTKCPEEYKELLDILYFRKEKFSYSEKDFDSVSVNILENIYKANKDQVSSKLIY